MNTTMSLSFAITHPDAELRFSDFFQSDQPMIDYWQAVGAVFGQMLEQMDDQALAKTLERRAMAPQELYDAASDEHGLTVLATAQSALVKLIGDEMGEETEIEFTYA